MSNVPVNDKNTQVGNVQSVEIINSGNWTGYKFPTNTTRLTIFNDNTTFYEQTFTNGNVLTKFTGTVQANYFKGDGSQLTGITGGVSFPISGSNITNATTSTAGVVTLPLSGTSIIGSTNSVLFSGTLTAGVIPYATGTNLIADSNAIYDGTDIVFAGNVTANNITGTNTGDLTLSDNTGGLSLSGQILSLTNVDSPIISVTSNVTIVPGDITNYSTSTFVASNGAELSIGFSPTNATPIDLPSKNIRFAFTGTGSATVQSFIPDAPGLLFQFDENTGTVATNSGNFNANNATLTYDSWGAPKFGTSSFAANGSVSASANPSNLITNGLQASFGCWAFCPASMAGSNQYWTLIDMGGGGNGALLGASIFSGVQRVSASYGGNGNEIPVADFMDDDWHHFAIIGNDPNTIGGFYVYLDGVAVQLIAYGDTNPLDKFMIGDGSDGPWPSLIDGVFYFPREISTGELTSIMSNTFPVNPPVTINGSTNAVTLSPGIDFLIKANTNTIDWTVVDPLPATSTSAGSMPAAVMSWFGYQSGTNTGDQSLDTLTSYSTTNSVTVGGVDAGTNSITAGTLTVSTNGLFLGTAVVTVQTILGVKTLTLL